jgi:hypothetical protein
MRGRAVEIEVVFLYVFAMIALVVRQAERTLIEERVLAIVRSPFERAMDVAVLLDSSKYLHRMRSTRLFKVHLETNGQM